MPRRVIQPARWATLLAVALAAIAAPPAWGAALPAVSDGDHLWRAAYDAENGRTVVYHHPREVADDLRLRRITALRGRVLPRGLAAADGTVWLWFRGGAVQQVRARPATHAVGFHYEGTVRPSLPPGVIPLAVDAEPGRAWAVVRVNTPEALAALRKDDTARSRELDPAEARDRARRIAMGLPPARPTAPLEERDDAAVDADASPAAEPASPVFTPQHRLVVEHGSRWRDVPLPEGWPGLAASWVEVVCVEKDGSRPTLLAGVDGGEPMVFRDADGEWREQRVALTGASTPLQATAVAGQLVVGWLDPGLRGGSSLRAALRVIRSDGTASLSASLEADATQPWCIGPWDGAVGLFTAPRGDAEGPDRAPPPSDTSPLGGEPESHPPTATPMTFTSVSLQGRTVLASRTVEPAWVSPWEGRADYLLMVGVMLVATGLAVATWRMAVPAEAVAKHSGPPAELWKRMAAALIDLAPAAGATMLAFGLSPTQFMARWPPQPEGMTWLAMAPTGVTIVLFLLHTGISEAVMGQSLGKRLLRVRVVDAEGHHPAAWRIALRGVLKTIDLLLWIALIVAILTPARQRLGDLAARTVVVRADEPARDDNDDDDASDNA